MNYSYPIPGAQSNPNAFVADNTGQLGTVDQSPDERTLVSVDYSQLTPGVILSAYSFLVKPGGEPQLRIENVALASPPPKMLSFYLEGGIGGVQYEVTIVTTVGVERRSDVLNVNVLGDNCGCGPLPQPPFSGATSSDGLTVVNEAPRYFISSTPPVGANVLDRWYNPANGAVYDYISNGPHTLWVPAQSSSATGSGRVNLVKLLPITPDGVTTVFTLTTVDGSTVNIIGSIDLFVSVDGVWQEGVVQYTAAGNTVTFTQAPTADAAIFMVWFAPVTGG